MANIELNKVYILSEIIAETGLPVLIRKDSWSLGFVFRVETVKNGTAFGTAFKNGVEHKRKYGAYTYSLSEQFCVIEIPKSRKELEVEQAVARLQAENASEMAAEKRESDEELARLSISDVVRTRGRVTEKAFLSKLLSGDHQKDIENEEKAHFARIVKVIKGLIGKIRASITHPENHLGMILKPALVAHKSASVQVSIFPKSIKMRHEIMMLSHCSRSKKSRTSAISLCCLMERTRRRMFSLAKNWFMTAAIQQLYHGNPQ